MAATAHQGATQAAVEILEAGGNAIDAAVAAAFALGVCEPAASGLGGQTMMMIRHAASGRTFALDGSSRAPNRATLDSLSRSDLKVGYRAATVPSTPAVLRYALETYGAMKLSQVLKPAIRLAEQGFAVSDLQLQLTRRELQKLRAGTAGPFFLQADGSPYPSSAIFRQPVLAGTLRRLAARGVKDFYSGRIAEWIHRDMVRHDGLIRKDDLAQVPRPIERRPLTCRFGPYRVFTFPPPGAGRTLIEMMNIYQHLPEAMRDLDSPKGAVALATMIRLAFQDRQDRPFDPNFYPQAPVKKMLCRDYARSLARKVVRRIPGGGETTHLSVMDAAGNVVALTQSIEKVYGSCCAAAELGFLYNNYMNCFDVEDMSHPYYLRPNAVPWASVAPTIVFKGRQPWLAIGSPGSERITPSVIQVIIRLEALTPLAAVDAPRLFCSLDKKVSIEAARMSDKIPEALRRHGFTVDVREPYSFFFGSVQMVMRDKGTFIGVADPRRDGSAGAPRK
jgi:gamma-glutamyltranspeptidase/glutathione hydrolase